MTPPNNQHLSLNVSVVVNTITGTFHEIYVNLPNSDQVGFMLPFYGTREAAEEYATGLLADVSDYVKYTISLVVPVEEAKVKTDD
jgi:hypothetical protein